MRMLYAYAAYLYSRQTGVRNLGRAGVAAGALDDIDGRLSGVGDIEDTPINGEALTEDSETAASLSELRDRAVQHTEGGCIKLSSPISTDAELIANADFQMFLF